MKRENYRDKATIKKRMWVVIVVLLIFFFVLTIRLSYVMIFKGREYADKAVEQWTSEVKIDARRGKILDTNGNELAVSANVYRIDFDLNAIRNYLTKHELSNGDIAPKIASALELDEEEVLKKLETKLPSGASAGSATLIRRVEKDRADKIKDLKINGIIVSPDTKRYYPNNNFLAHVLGSTNVDGQGLTGIELQYNKDLSGTPGMRIAELDRRNEELPYNISNFTPPVDGKDVELTVDEKIQFFAEKAASIALKNNKAKAASVIVSNPKTGEILAIANKPDFDPNKPYEGAEDFEGNTAMDKLQKMWRNRAVSDTFESGSIFKVITSIAGLEEKVLDVGEHYTCGGSTTVQNRRIKCWKSGGHGTQNFGDILKNSCNVGFIEAGRTIGKEKLNEYIKKFGFGQKSGIDLPGEAKGIVKSTESITDVDLATIAFGQTDTVNMIQFLSAFNAIANDGVWIQPHIMKDIVHFDKNGEKIIDKDFKPEKKELASKENTTKLRTYLERVVKEGSAKKTYMEGYRIGGKTGTAQKVNPQMGAYENGKYISSFVAMSPVNDPKVSIMISIDEPSAGEYYAGVITTPVAKILFEDIINYLNIEKQTEEVSDDVTKEVLIPEVRGLQKDEASKVLNERGLKFDIEGDAKIITEISPKPGYSVKEGTKINLYSDETSNYNKEVVTPNLIGKTKESALKILDSIGLKASFEGTGIVDSQSIKEGELITKGTVVKLKLSEELGD